MTVFLDEGPDVPPIFPHNVIIVTSVDINEVGILNPGVVGSYRLGGISGDKRQAVPSLNRRQFRGYRVEGMLTGPEFVVGIVRMVVPLSIFRMSLIEFVDILEKV